MSDQPKGMRNEPLFVWQVFDHDERWGVIAAALQAEPGGPVSRLCLLHREEQVVAGWEWIAQAHGKAAGRPIRLARYELAQVIR